MARASEAALSRLHAKLAEVMNEALAPIEIFGNPDDPTEVTASLPANNPALFTAIAKFLKDNEITAVPETGSAVSDLRNKLEEQRTRRPLPKVDPADAQFGIQTSLNKSH